MKNIFKKIGFLCTALLALSLGTSVNKVEAATQETKTITFNTAPTSKTKMVYEIGNITMTWEKGSGTELNSSYSNPIRVYAKNKVTFTADDSVASINSMVITTTSTTYASNAASTWTGASASVSGSKVTVTPSKTEFYIIASAQTRWSSLSVTYTLNESSIHECKFTVENTDDYYLAEPATCSTKAKYYLSCEYEGCKEKGEDTFEYGDPLGHNFDDIGACTRCDEFNPELTLDDRVNLLFTKYYNEGTYTKDTVLNINEFAENEVKSYLHAGAQVKNRRTVYEPGSISMVTSNDGKSYNPATLSKYENKNGSVYHTGLGGDWAVNWNSVEDKFITLNDFVNSTLTGWTYSEGVYTFNLLVSDEMTRFAREFVAPMWLDTEEAKNYVVFDKLTVEEKGEALVMKLYASGDTGKITNEEGIFSQATITLGATNLSILATFEFGENGAAGHKETTTSKSTYNETFGNYKLSITNADKFYLDSFDEKGNSCIKLGTGSAAGKFSFTVSEDVNSVIIYVAGYKANIAEVTVNGKTTKISTLSNNGEYTAVEVDTTTNKTVSFTTTSNGYRAMINSIEFR